jgi:hypothetical protein
MAQCIKNSKVLHHLFPKMSIHHTKHSVLQELIQVVGGDGMSKLIENHCTFPGHYTAKNQNMKVL